MPIFNKKLVFVHIPKCAGTSMQQILLKKYGHNFLAKLNLNDKKFIKLLRFRILIYLFEIFYIFYNLIYGRKVLLRMDKDLGSYEHATMQEILDNPYIKVKKEDTLSFTIVRNPYSRLVSLYNYTKPKCNFSDFVDSIA